MKGGTLALALALLATLAAPARAAHPAWPPPASVTRTLDNGLVVHALPAPGSGLVHVRLVVPGGVAADPAGQEGVAALTAQMLAAGTTLRTAQRIAADLDRAGASLDAAAGPEDAVITATFLARDAEEAVSLVADLAMNPVFLDEEFRRAQRIALARLQARDPAALAADRIAGLALPGHPAARPPLGALESVRRLRREEVRAFHRGHYRPRGARVAIAGDVEPGRAFALAAEHFGAWSGEAPDPAAVTVDPAAAGGVRIFDRPGAMAEVRLAWPTPGRGAPDRDAREFAAALFEREWSVRRPEWRVSLQAFAGHGVWSLAAVVPADSVGAAARAMRDAFTDFTTRPRTAAAVREGLRLARRLGPLQLETLAQRAARRLAAEPGDTTLAIFAARVASLGPAEVRAAAARGLDPRRPVVTAAGPADRIRPQLDSFGPVEIAEAEGAAARHPATATPEERRRGRNWILQAVEAHGGLDRLAGIHDTVVESEMSLTVRGETVDGRLRQLRKDPHRLKLVTTLGARQTFQVLNRDAGWSLLPGDTTLRVADSTEIANLRATYRLDPVRLLRAAADTAAVAAHRGREMVGDREAERVDVAFADGGTRRLFLDPVSRRLLGAETLDRRGLALVPTRTVFADYREVQGVWWPHDERRTVAGEPYLHLRAVAVRFNSNVSDTEFEPPAAGRRR